MRRCTNLKTVATNNDDITVIKRERVFDDFLKVDEAVVQVGEQQQRRLSLERGDAAAAIVIRTDDNRVLFTRQFRYPTLEKGPGRIIEIVAGVIESDETPESTIRRELREEIGFEPDRLELIYSFYVSPGGSSERIHLFFAEVSEEGKVGAGGGVPAEGEDIEIIELTLSEMSEMLDAGELEDAKTLIGAMWLLNRTGEC